MSFTADDLGVIGDLATAIGLVDAAGNPVPEWFGAPDESMATVLANETQRDALLSFVDEALGGSERETDDAGLIWLPIVEVPDPKIVVYLTIDDRASGVVNIGIGAEFASTDPVTETRLSIPLFRVAKEGGSVPNALLLGQPGARIRLSTAITVDASAPTPGDAHLGSLGIEIDLPTASGDGNPIFGVSLGNLQLAGADEPHDLSISVDSIDDLDDTVVELILSLLREQAEAAGGSALVAVAGLLGLGDDNVIAFPIDTIASEGVEALAGWLNDLLTDSASRLAWLEHLAMLLGGTRTGDEVQFNLGPANLAFSIPLSTGPSGHQLLSPSISVSTGDADARVEARCELCRIDLVDGSVTALGNFGVWAAAGNSTNPVLDTTGPATHVDTLRIGFELDAGANLVFVLAADGVVIGSQNYATLDLTSTDAVMDGIGAAVDDIANDILDGLGDGLGSARVLLGLDSPPSHPTVPTVSVADLLSDPVGAVTGYWDSLVTGFGSAVPEVLGFLRDSISDAGSVALPIKGSGTRSDPWLVPLVDNVSVRVIVDGHRLAVSLITEARVDSLGHRCTVLETTLAATLVEVDLGTGSADLLPAVSGSLVARERGARPTEARLDLSDSVAIVADHVGLVLSWRAQGGLSAEATAPNLRLEIDGDTIDVPIPTIDDDGLVTLAAEGWASIQRLVGELSQHLPGLVGDIVDVLGWKVSGEADQVSLSLAGLVDDAENAIGNWLPNLAVSDVAPKALALLADLFSGTGTVSGAIGGSGHPDDPYRLILGDGLPEPAVWFPPAGLDVKAAVTRASEAVRNWHPGDLPLSARALEAALKAEADVDVTVAGLVGGRTIADGLEALITRWTGTDGRISEPLTVPAGIEVHTEPVAFSQLLDRFDLETEIGRVPDSVIWVAIGSDAWSDAPPDRRIDLTAPGLGPEMFAAPTGATGDWFVNLGARDACRLANGDADGTVGQADRLQVVVDAVASTDAVIVALAGAGHAARVVAQRSTAIGDLILVGTPLGPVALSALTTQPTADAVRLLYRLLPGEVESEDPDLAIGRSLINAMVELADLTDPAVELRQAVDLAPIPRAELNIKAVFGEVGSEAVSRAITAVVVAGLTARALLRSTVAPDAPTAAIAGFVVGIQDMAGGTVSVSGDTRLGLVGLSIDSQSIQPELRVRLSIGDRLGWITSTPEYELRRISIDATLPLGGTGSGRATIVFHDARVLGTSWERLIVGTGTDELPLLPEARTLLDIAVSRLIADVAANPGAAAAVELAESLGLIDAAGAVNDAFDQLVHDPVGLAASAMNRSVGAVDSAMSKLLDLAGAQLDLVSGELRIQAGSESSGLFGWNADVTVAFGSLADPTTPAVSGTVVFGSDSPGPAGSLQLAIDLAGFDADLRWHHPDSVTTTIELWPHPDGSELATMMADIGPSVAGHVAIEVMRRADETVRPIVDATLDAMGVLGGSVGDLDRPLRPLVGLLNDPSRWLRTAAQMGSQPANAQRLIDAVRPLLGLSGSDGGPLTLATGVSLAVGVDGDAIALTAAIDTSAFAATISGPLLSAGVSATLFVGPNGPPQVSTGFHIGLPSPSSGRSAVHVDLARSGSVSLFLRPSVGSDISLVPFAGLGSLADAVAAAALPFIFDQLGGLAAPIGPAITTVGDALALRSGAPLAFDADALRAWSADPVSALSTAVPSIVDTGLAALASVTDAYVPSSVSITATQTVLTATVEGITVRWIPSNGTISVAGTDIAVPGIETISFDLTLSAAGIDSVTAELGPANIDVGGVSLQPFVAIAAGNSAPGGAGIAVGLEVNAVRRFAARWMFDPSSFSLVVGDGALDGIDSVIDELEAALRMVEVVIDLVASLALSTDAVQDLLDIDVSGGKLGDLLVGVLLEPGATSLIDNVFDPATLADRALVLFDNVAGIGLSATIDELTISLQRQSSGVIGVQFGLTDRFELVSGDTMIWLETDDAWIENNPPGDGGIFIGVVNPSGGLAFEPSLAVYGVGIRIGKLSGPLLDFGLTLESVALHGFAEIDSGGFGAGGVQIQFSNLAVAADGASGGNPIASGIMSDTGSQPPKAAFSPAIAVQKHGSNATHVTLRAGDGDGPWWIGIQTGFGPLYIEQIGFGVSMPNQKVERVSILFDGSVSMFGLVCAVDDLEITYLVSRNDFFNSSAWDIDLAGLAVSADMAGLSIAGGLLKSVDSNDNVEYLGMLLARFGVYGITIYGGYGQGESNGESFVAFFAIGAIVGPIGGPPAFFLTGIGGGFGINRELIVPTELSQFGDYPLIQALDTAASPGNPMEQLRALGEYFPAQKDTFWFAAGISFTSFVIVEGIAVVAVEVGDGLDINLLGLARVALPRPEVALVSIELALLVRFSSSEGILWVQGQLTDNSWLLYRDVKLTGGFAFVIWFKGENRGQFVLTMGGYHPDFHRAGYPEVPRLGLEWQVSSNIVIKAGGYFALTSEALMAGGDFEASAEFGPGWAEVAFGAHGIVYFDPFHYKVEVYARIHAGVTVSLWILGTVTISISIGASIMVEGPDFHGVAKFEVGPIELEVEFGSSTRYVDPPLPAATFIDKYLDRAPDGRANTIAVVTSIGAQPSGNGDPTPDGNPDRPFLVVPEFSLILTTVVPTTKLRLNNPSGIATSNHSPTRTVGVAPMGTGSVQPEISITWSRNNVAVDMPFVFTEREFGAFPVGVWGPPQDDDHRALPQGEVIGALSELDAATSATIAEGGPEIPYYQVEIGPRLPLPFSRSNPAAQRIRKAGKDLAALVTVPESVDGAFALAERFMANTASPTALAALSRERQAPPNLSTLGEGLDTTPSTTVPDVGEAVVAETPDHTIHAPALIGFMAASGPVSLRDPSLAGARQVTTVSDVRRPWRIDAPTLASVQAGRSRSVATELLVVEPQATLKRRSNRTGTLIATGDVPPSEASRSKPAVVATRGGDGGAQLGDFSSALKAGRRTRRGNTGAVVAPGDVAVLRLGNARRDTNVEAVRPTLAVAGAPIRVIAVGDGGSVVADVMVREQFTVPMACERLVVVGQGAPDDKRPFSATGLFGWHASMDMAYVGWSTAVGPGCIAKTRGELIGRHRERAGVGWLRGTELSRGSTTVVTRFVKPMNTVVIVIDDPSAFGADVSDRELILGLDGAKRTLDASGAVVPPLVVTAENRSLLAYSVEPDAKRSTKITVVSEPGWSIVGVLASDSLDPAAAVAAITGRGLEAAMAGLGLGRSGTSRLSWINPKEEN